LRNIINNAINYTLSGEVSISGNVYNGQVMVSIHDTGCGIHEVDQRRIFAEFVQLSNESRTQETGLGVGLAIVKQIDEMLDLNLQLRSEPGVGSTFSFSLPQATAS
jgi:signal transduction histidine kinase